MKILNTGRKQSGVGLIEILIVLVVLVIAWAAIAALQGTLMSGSSTTKARNEALELAREKTEELRTTIEKSQYVAALVDTDNVLVNDPGGTIQGVNATFTRAWSLDDLNIDGAGADEDFVKKLTMQVSWVNNEGVTENVVLNSVVTYSNRLAIASYATGGTGDVTGTPTPNQETATEGPAPPGTVINTGTLDDAGDPNTTDDDIYMSTDGNGNVVIYQNTPLASNVLLTAFGGKIIKISGTIYYDSPEPFVQATSPAFCQTTPRTKADCGITSFFSSTNCAKYACYAGGDCKNGGDGCPGDTTQLPVLDGGWWGKVGDFFPSLANANQFPTICTGDSIDIAARLFYTKRVSSGSITGYAREGINTSFECYDTLISAANDSACSNLISELAGYGISIDPNSNLIADHQAIRPMSQAGTNTVLAATNNSYDNSVFPNFCGGGSSSSSSSSSGASSSSGSSSGSTSSSGSSSGSTSSSGSSSGSTSSSGSSSGSTSSSGSGSSSGGDVYTHRCQCNYRNATKGVESVIGMTLDVPPVENIGCCTLAGCTANLPNSISNNSSFYYDCPIP